MMYRGQDDPTRIHSLAAKGTPTGKFPGKLVQLDELTPPGKLLAACISTLRSTGIESIVELKASPLYSHLQEYALSLNHWPEKKRATLQVEYQAVKALRLLPYTNLAARLIEQAAEMKNSDSELAPFRTIVLQQIAMKYPQGLKAEEVGTMDYTLYCALRLLYDNLGYTGCRYQQTLLTYIDEEYRASYNKRKREYAATRDRTEEEREVRRAQNRVSYRARGLVIAAETAKACASLPVGVLQGKSLYRSHLHTSCYD